MSRKKSVAAFLVCLLSIFTGRLEAEYLQGFSGNVQAASTTGADFSAAFAVLDSTSGGSAGDAFGTGFAGFDALANVDTTARCLYLYQGTAINADFENYFIGDGMSLFTETRLRVRW